MEEILKAVVYCYRLADGKDITEQVICIPPSQATVLAKELSSRQASGELDFVQIGRIYIQATPFTDYEDGVEAFLTKVDEVKLPGSGFTGFDDVELTE